MRITTKAVFEWDKDQEQYIEVESEGYEYEGPVDLAVEISYPGQGVFTGPKPGSLFGGSDSGRHGAIDAMNTDLYDVSEGGAGTFWDTHIGREGLVGWIGDVTGLWESGTVADERNRAKQRIKDLYGTAISKTEDYKSKIEDYYKGPGGLMGRTREAQALKNVQLGSESQQLYDTSYGKSDFANIEQRERPGNMQNIYASADIGMQNSMLTQKFNMNKSTFELEDKVLQLEMGQEDKLNALG